MSARVAAAAETALTTFAREVIRKVHAGEINSDPKLLAESMRSLANMVEPFDAALAGELEDTADLVVF